MNAGLVTLIVIVVVALVLLAVFMARRRRSEGLRERFGPEYERTMARAGDRRAAHPGVAVLLLRRRRGHPWLLSQAAWAGVWRISSFNPSGS